jgi:hypothetical protein
LVIEINQSVHFAETLLNLAKKTLDPHCIQPGLK